VNLFSENPICHDFEQNQNVLTIRMLLIKTILEGDIEKNVANHIGACILVHIER